MPLLQDAAQLSACWVYIGTDTEQDLINCGTDSLGRQAVKTKLVSSHKLGNVEALLFISYLSF